MSTRHVWERYSRESSYRLYRQDIEYSPIDDICVVDTRGGYFLFMKSAPTVVSTNKLKYSGSYRMVDDGNLQGQKVSSSAYPYATFVWADNPDEYSDAGMQRSPSAGNTYSGDITLNSAGVWADNTIYKAADNGYWGGRVYSDSGYWVCISLGSSATYPGTSSYEIEEWRTTTDYSQGSTDYGPVSGAGSGDYPQNSYSGSYWYVYQGSDTIDPAAVTLPAGIFGGDTVTVTVTPSAGKVYGGNVTYTWQYRLDGAEAVSASHQSGDQITLHIDPRVMARGAHTITVTASKEAYAQAMAQYTYTVPAWDGSDIEGGLSAPFQDWLGRKLLPKTLAQDVLGPDGKDVATWIAELQQALGSLDPVPLEPVVRAAPPSGSYALAPGTLYDFTQTDAAALTFTFTEPEAGKAAAYHVMFRCGSTAAAVTLPEGVKTPDGYVIEAGRVYELSVLEGLLTYQSWEADA